MEGICAEGICAGGDWGGLGLVETGSPLAALSRQLAPLRYDLGLPPVSFRGFVRILYIFLT